MDNSIHRRILFCGGIWLLGKEEACPLGDKRPLASNLLCLLAHHVGFLPGSRIWPARPEVNVAAAALEVIEHRSCSQLMECRVLFLEGGNRDGEGFGIVVGCDLNLDTFNALRFTD